MKVDLHLHDNKYSTDSHISIEEIVREAKRKGLDGIALTNHENPDVVKEIDELVEKYDFVIFPGVEYLTKDGDIVAFGIDKLPEEQMSAQEFIEYVDKFGGTCTAAHPYRTNNRGLEDKLYTVKGLTAIEGYNGSTSDYHNGLAVKAGKELGIQVIGSSDAHVVEKVGVYATLLPYKVKNVKELIEALKTNRCKPLKYVNNNYEIIE
ncbi:PHP domain-containing protein [uncultured Fusobacterium sp.]|jgi:predicted metal-dependent phosphoesterase TrpH|uniref:PHP domain-containing protein n=1 Tax=uncultured Fusobacterium sp. TaxID=159267 RepID=UPI0025D78595|nr:PHP domain-containing protein [uncultured Fusobacterium sp.]